MSFDSSHYIEPISPFTRVGSQVQSLSRPPLFPNNSRGLVASVADGNFPTSQNSARTNVDSRRSFVQSRYSRATFANRIARLQEQEA